MMESSDSLSVALADGENKSSSSGVGVAEVKNEMFRDFDEALDHVVLIERRRMLLSRRAAGFINEHVEGSSDELPNGESVGTERVLHDNTESASPGLCSSSAICSSNSTIVGTCVSSSHFLNNLIKSGNNTDLQENDKICSKAVAELNSDDLMSHKPNLSSSNSTKVKDEPFDHIDSCNFYDKNMNQICGSIWSVKSEITIPNEPHEIKLDEMRLQDRIEFLSSQKVSGLTPWNYEHLKPSNPGCSSTVSESPSSISIKQRRKRKKTATDSVEIALEEDAPGLLQILVDKGVLVDELKLYGEMESDEDLDESFSEDTFGALEGVISKVFTQRHSFLKFSSVRCTKASRASYCLACLVTLVEQTRYLHFRNWPVEWGWCRDLQSFVFVFERHKRIVLERPEYGYATYFFEIVDSLPVHWQIKRLVIAMKLTSCGRLTLLENRPLSVGEDLTEGEAGVLMNYGWTPNSGLGTMLNYRGRVVHDRKHEDISEWRSKIGKLLVDGYNGGTLVAENILKIAEFTGSETTEVKLEH